VLPSPPEAEQAQPPVVAPEPPPPQRKDAAVNEEARAQVFAPAPPPPSPPRQQPVALQESSARWMRLPSEPFAKTRRDEAPAAAAASAAPANALDCGARDLLRPPLAWEGMDAGRARELAERARAAGASDVILATAPVLRLTLVVPAAAWPGVQDLLAASGISIPEPVRVAPEGGDCLEVAIDPRP
jgi:hypothetical protein